MAQNTVNTFISQWTCWRKPKPNQIRGSGKTQNGIMRGNGGNDWIKYVDNSSRVRQKVQVVPSGQHILQWNGDNYQSWEENRSQRKYGLKPINCRKTKIKMVGERNACICIVRSPLNWANDTPPGGMIHYHMEKTQPMIKDGRKPLNSRIYLEKLKKNVLVELWQKYFKILTGLTNADMEGRGKKKKHVKICDIMPTSKGEGRIRENLKCTEKQAASARAVPERTDFIHL